MRVKASHFILATANVGLGRHCRLRVTICALAREGFQIVLAGAHFAAMLAIALGTRVDVIERLVRMHMSLARNLTTAFVV